MDFCARALCLFAVVIVVVESNVPSAADVSSRSSHVWASCGDDLVTDILIVSLIAVATCFLGGVLVLMYRLDRVHSSLQEKG